MPNGGLGIQELLERARKKRWADVYTPAPDYGLRGIEYPFYPFTWWGMGARAFPESPGAHTGLVQFPQMMEKPEQVPEGVWANWLVRHWEPMEGILPGGEAYEEYMQLPMMQRMGYEAIPWVALAALPTAGAMRAGLAGARGAVPRIARGALAPVAGAEQAMALPFRGAQWAAQRAVPILRGGEAGGFRLPGLGRREWRWARGAPTKAAETLEEIQNPTLRKLGELMQATQKARRATTRVRKVELRRRVAQAQRELNRVYRKTGDIDAAWRASASRLKGTMPTRTEALKEVLTANEFAQLRTQIKNHPTLRYFERLRGDRAINKLLSTDEILQPSELKLLERIFPGISRINTLKQQMSINGWRWLIDAANLPRALLASTDLSATLRQGGILLARYPQEFAGTMKWQLRTLFSSKNWQALDDIIRADPDFGLFDMYGGYLAPQPGYMGRLWAREETFMSRLAERIPIVRVSERAFTAGLNYLRFRSFKNGLNLFRQMGATTDNDIAGLVRFINAASGRGNIEALGTWARGAAPTLNALMFSPRLVFSKLELPRYLVHSSRAVRQYALRTLVQFLGFGTSVLALAKLAGAEVETDPRSSDFAKIKIGNTRLDIWTGYVQWVRFLGQLFTAERKITTTGRIQEANRWQIVWNMMQSKGSPIAGIILDLLKGTTYLGEPMFEGGWDTVKRELRDRLTPLFAQDLWDAIETDGLLGGLAASPGFLGIGAVSYKEEMEGKPSLPRLPELPRVPSMP